jgi:hypothetical protein
VARPLDFSTLTSAERLVLMSGVLLFANGFLPWWFRATARGQARMYGAGLTGWGTIATLAGAAAAITVVARASIWPEPAPRRDGLLYSGFGGLASLALGAQLVLGSHNYLGVGAEAVFAKMLTAGGILRRRERRSGWG